MPAYVVGALVPSARAFAICPSWAFDTNASTTLHYFARAQRHRRLQSAYLPPENINDVLHLADAQNKCRREKSGSGKGNRHEQRRQLLKEPHVRPRIEPQVIA